MGEYFLRSTQAQRAYEDLSKEMTPEDAGLVSLRYTDPMLGDNIGFLRISTIGVLPDKLEDIMRNYGFEKDSSTNPRKELIEADK